MKKRTVEYTDNPEIGELEIVEDFLPPPEVMAKMPAVVTAEIELSNESMNFLIKQAKQHNISYKRMIRRVLEEYVAQAQAAEDVKQQG